MRPCECRSSAVQSGRRFTSQNHDSIALSSYAPQSIARCNPSQDIVRKHGMHRTSGDAAFDEFSEKVSTTPQLHRCSIFRLLVSSSIVATMTDTSAAVSNLAGNADVVGHYFFLEALHLSCQRDRQDNEFNSPALVTSNYSVFFLRIRCFT